MITADDRREIEEAMSAAGDRLKRWCFDRACEKDNYASNSGDLRDAMVQALEEARGEGCDGLCNDGTHKRIRSLIAELRGGG